MRFWAGRLAGEIALGIAAMIDLLLGDARTVLAAMPTNGENCGGSLMPKQLSFPIAEGGSNPTSPLQLFVQIITKETAVSCYQKWHYLGKQGFLATYNFGAYWDGSIMGAISFHPPSAPETVQGLFGTQEQKGIFEIGRLAMSDGCPKNSESRFIAVSVRLLKRYELVRAIITYADTAQNHEGIIYKASGFRYVGLTAPKMDFWVNGQIQQRGLTKGVKGEWRPRSRKHLFVKVFKL